jgi:hypothetical protein
MDKIKYVGIDLHQSTCLIAVHDARGKVEAEEAVETEAQSLRNFFKDLKGTIHVAFEVGTQSGWLYEILKGLASSITVCDVRGHKRRGNKSDRIDAHKLANWLRLGELTAIYQGDRNIRRLRDLAHGYLATVSDSIRIMNRIKALYRSWSIRCAGRDVYYKRNRQGWLSKFPLAESRMRAVLYYAQLDLLKEQRKEIKKEFLKQARRYPIQKILRDIPGFGPIRSAFAIAVIGTPHHSGRNDNSGRTAACPLSSGLVPITKWLLVERFANTKKTIHADLLQISIAFLNSFLRELQTKRFEKSLLKLFTDARLKKVCDPNWLFFRSHQGLQPLL